MSSAATAKEDQNQVILDKLETMKLSFGDNCDTMRQEMDEIFQFDADFVLVDQEEFPSTLSMVSGERRYTI